MVNFWNNDGNYYSAYRCIRKDVDSVHNRKHHSNLDEVPSPRTKNSTQAYLQARESYAQENPTDGSRKQRQKATSRKRPTQFEVSELLFKKMYLSWHQAFLWSKEKKRGRQADLAVFVLARSSKSLNDLIENTWKMNNAKASIEREKQR